MIPPRETSCMYLIVRDEIKWNLEKRVAPKRATYHTLEKLGCIDAVPYASHVLAIRLAHEIWRTLKLNNTDLLKKIEKQQGDGGTGNSAIQKN